MSAVLYFGSCRALGWILTGASGFCCHCCIYSKTFYLVISDWETCLDTYFNNNLSLKSFQVCVVEILEVNGEKKKEKKKR